MALVALMHVFLSLEVLPVVRVAAAELFQRKEWTLRAVHSQTDFKVTELLRS
ncbi:hypothetical protein [Leptolyngbya iicbica]|uniref:Uncharacterized protein n=1 Tax=Lyngbya confervoides BDU141951 TaxID=1574623 RepID=A0A8T6QU97_9CYAN|nr:hypothetical protein [Leptolyngbya sp. LK]